MKYSIRHVPFLFALFAVLFFSNTIFSQSFTIVDTLKGVEEGHVEWGDFDNDGDLDILLTGDAQPVFTQIYENRFGLFVERRFEFLNARNSHVTWADYDNDGDLDILVQGRDEDGDESARLYRNDGNEFTEIDTDIVGFEKGYAAWGDYDNDGDLDLIVAGDLKSGADDNLAQLYRNDGNAVFTKIDAGILAGENPGIDWGDYDKDGDLDLLISGEGDDLIMKVYRNANGVFQDIGADLFPIFDGSLEWGDFDGDGDLDILSAGEDGDFFFTIIYQNNSGEFQLYDSTLTGIQDGRAGWGDLDNDGDLDMLIIGDADTSDVAQIYHNDNGVFTLFENQPLPGIKQGWFDFGDFDNDGDLDIVLLGDAGDRLTIVLRNDAITPNSPPRPPQGLNAIVTRDSIVFEWQPATDAETPQASLTYNLYVGSESGGVDIISPMADPASGFRKVAEYGNVDGGVRWKFQRDLPKGEYFWSVQTIDNGFAGSAFAPERTFSIVFPPPPENPQVLTAEAGEVTLAWDKSSDPDVAAYRIYLSKNKGPFVLTDSVSATSARLAGLDSPLVYTIAVTAVDNAGNESKFSQNVYAAPSLFTDAAFDLPDIGAGTVAWGDFDGDDDLDLFVAGEQLDGSLFSDILQNNNGAFDAIGAEITKVGKAAAAWGDYNGDGRLDLAIIGENSGGRPVSLIYRNDDDGEFTDIKAPLIGVRGGDLAWGDFDNDGDLDLLLAGQANDGTPVSRVYRYIGGDEFLSSNAEIQDLQNAAVAWGDYNQDRDLDILLSGENREGDRISRLYRNNGGMFSERNEPFTDAANASAAFADFDNDGDLDIVIAGEEEDGVSLRLYQNDEGDFAELKLPFTGVEGGALDLADADNDGVVELLASGGSEKGRLTRLYKLVENQFQEIVTAMPGLAGSDVQWGDFDNDGDLDAVICGRTNQGPITRIYRNESVIKNTPPGIPGNLRIAQTRNTFIPAWDSATDAETPQAGLSYNLRIGTSSGSDDVFAGMANDGNGRRRVSQSGNAGQTNRWPITILKPGTYYWSVQAVDNGRLASNFAPEQTFEFSPLPPPENLIAVGGNEEIELSWDAAAPQSAEKYYVYGGTRPRPLSLLDSTANASETSILISGLSNDTSYFFRVATKDTSAVLSDFSLDAASTPSLFTEIPNKLTRLAGLNDAATIWGDLDNDGDLDIVYAGETSAQLPVSFVYRNLGNNRFEDARSEIDSVLQASIDLGDYDNDGDLDLILTGKIVGGATRISRIYDNVNGEFQPTAHDLAGVVAEPNSVAWGDYDNDGDLDLLISGDANEGKVGAIYENQNGVFKDIEAGLAEMQSSSAAWGDLDNDGDLDIVMAGRYDDDPTTLIYQNTDSGFVQVETGIAGARRGDVQLGDFDNDGDLDLMLTGHGDDDDLAKLYRNNGDFQFEEISDFDFTIDEGVAAWGDYDNDGDLDLLVSGDDHVSGKDITRIYRNDGGKFTNSGISLPGMDDCDAVWGDYDNDGDLDLLLSGKVKGDVGFTAIFRNNLRARNQPPDAPSQLTAAVSDSFAALSWAQVTDAETPPDGLTYNLRVGSAPGGFDLVTPMIGRQSGKRLIAAKGNLHHNTNWTLKNLPPGTYYWSVQAVDHSYAVSGFALEQSFTVGAAALAFSEETLDFGQVAVGTKAALRLTLTNTGSETILLDAPQMSGADASAFSVENFTNAALQAGGSIELKISFAEEVTGQKEAVLEIRNGAAESLGTVTLRAEATDAARPFLTLRTRAIDLSNVRVGQTKTRMLKLANSGNSILTIREVRFQGAAASDFEIPDRSRLPLRIAPGDDGFLELTFSPTKANVRNALLELVTDTPMPQTVISLRGSGVSASVFLSRANLDFEAVNIGEFQDLSLTIRNNGSDTVTVADVGLSGDNGDDFLALLEPGATLFPGVEETFFVRFQPRSPGAKAAFLRVAGDADFGEIGLVELAGTGLDESPPSLQNTTGTHTVTLGRSFEISARVDDNFSVQFVDVFFREGGKAERATTAQQRMQPGADNGFLAAIATDSTSDIPFTRGFEYKIVALDGSGQASGSEWISVQVRLPENTLSTTQIGGAGDDAYRLIAVPLILENASVNDLIVDDLGEQNIKNWRLWSIDPSNANTDFPYFESSGSDPFTSGSAKFLITSETVNIGAGAGLTPETLKFFEIPLHAGWNMVGNPFNFDIPIDNVDLKNGNTASIFGFEDGFRQAQRFEPWKGYLVKATGGVDTLRIWPSEDIVGRGRALAKPGQTVDWRIAIKAVSGSARDVENFVGAAEDASTEWDRYERFEPPPIGAFVKLWFSHKDWTPFPDIYTTDFQPPSEDGHVWEFRVKSSKGGPVTLEFDELASAPEHFEIRLFDVQLNHAVDVRRDGEYIFRPLNRGANRFKLVVGTAEFVEQESGNALGLPTTFELSQNFPNPFNPATTIRYGLPRPARVTLKIYNLLGREVATLIDEDEKPAGYHFSVWDGRNNAGARVASGIFIYQVHAGGRVLTQKMTLLR